VEKTAGVVRGMGGIFVYLMRVCTTRVRLGLRRSPSPRTGEMRTTTIHIRADIIVPLSRPPAEARAERSQPREQREGRSLFRRRTPTVDLAPPYLTNGQERLGEADERS
jgi:hypothetical protein